MTCSRIYHPIGPRCYRLLQRDHLAGIRAMAGHSRCLFPLSDQQQAVEIARRWTLPHHGCAWVCCLSVDALWLNGFPCQDWSNSGRVEYRIPTSALGSLVQHLAYPPDVSDHLTLSDANRRLMRRWVRHHSLVTDHQLHALSGEKPLPFLPTLAR
ncbi:hypothetical protein [Aestuariirhabdus sp. LZHN29]|uniref:hypothetical protein n=1 Tax=Aestuariirhabdus sp. LZHN29 TaxID=3417462 RepID=UPI003CF0BE7C